MHPELMYSLNETSAIVRAVLDELKIPYRYPVARSGIVATVGEQAPPHVVTICACLEQDAWVDRERAVAQARGGSLLSACVRTWTLCP